MSNVVSLARAFRQPARKATETPALVRRETAEDVGLVTIGPKGYGFRAYPGHLTCRRIVRLFTDNGFSGDSYDVAFFSDRPATCTCADFTYRRKDETGKTCRHIRAVVALELDGAPKSAADPLAELDAAVADMDAMFARHAEEAPF
jgi:hypothetical protein